MRLSYENVLARLSWHVDQHNEAQTQLPNKVRGGAMLTFQIIMNGHLKRVEAAMRVPEFTGSDQLPAYFTNRPRIAALVKCAPRTVYNHIQVLIQAGLVVERWHGWQRDFELWINPWFLFPDAFPAPVVVDLAQNCIWPAAFHRRPVLPLRSPAVTSQKATRPESVVAAVATPGPAWRTERAASPGDRINQDSAGKTAGYAPGVANLVDTIHHPTSIGALTSKALGLHKPLTRSAATGVSAAPVNVPTERQSTEAELGRDYRALVNLFWKQVKPQCWPGSPMSHAHNQAVLELIWTDVFGSFADCPSWTVAKERYEVRLEQIKKAKAHADRCSWTSFLPPKRYFSLEFYHKQKELGQKGSFWFTWEWILADRKRAARVDKDRLLKKAIRSVRLEQAPRGLRDGQRMGSLELTNYWRNRLLQVGDRDLLDQYETALLTPLPGRSISPGS